MEAKSDKPSSNEKKRKLQDAPVEPVVSPKAKRVKPDTKSSEQTNLCYTYFVQFEHPTDTTKKSSNKSSETKPQKSKSTDKVPTSQPEPSTSAAQADASANDPTEDAEDSDEDGDPSQLVHESLTGTQPKGKGRHSQNKYVPSEETSEQRNLRTIFVGNVVVDVMKNKVRHNSLPNSYKSTCLSCIIVEL